MMPEALLVLPAAIAAGGLLRAARAVDVRRWAGVIARRSPLRLEDMQDDLEAANTAWIDIIVRTSAACGYDQDEVAKFFGRVRVTAGCWYWTGPTSNGYGLHGSKGRSQSAHRWAYEFVHGPAPAGLHLDHVCHTRDLNCRGGRTCLHRSCVNPMHLEPVSPAENRLRGALHEMAVDKRTRRLQIRNKTHAWRWHRAAS